MLDFFIIIGGVGTEQAEEQCGCAKVTELISAENKKNKISRRRVCGQ